MQPSTWKSIDFGRRCNHCIAEVGRKKLKACSRCQRVRYCSKDCQRAAWKSHKPICMSAAEDRAAIDPNYISSYDVLDKAFTKWLQYWTFTLNRWAYWGIDLANHPRDRAATHCCLMRIKWHPNPPTRAQTFMMTTAEIMSNEEFFDVLWTEIGPTEKAFEDLKEEKLDEKTMRLFIFCEGIVHLRSFRLDCIDRLRSVSPEVAKAVADRWAANLIHIIETGDATKENSDRHLLHTIPESMAGLPAVNVLTQL